MLCWPDLKQLYIVIHPGLMTQKNDYLLILRYNRYNAVILNEIDNIFHFGMFNY